MTTLLQPRPLGTWLTPGDARAVIAYIESLRDSVRLNDLGYALGLDAGTLQAERDAAVHEAAALRAGVEAYLALYDRDGWMPEFDRLRALLAERPTPEADRG